MSSDIPLVIFDVETTGLSPIGGDRIIEVAALKVVGDAVCGRFESLVHPRRDIPFAATRVHGITDTMVCHAPYMEDLLPQLEEFFRGARVVGHNINFDLRFLQAEQRRAGGDDFVFTQSIDTMKMARLFLPGLGRYSLASVAARLQIAQGQIHRAMADVEMTWEVFRRLYARATQQRIRGHELLASLCAPGKTQKSCLTEKMTALRAALIGGGAIDMVYACRYEGLMQYTVILRQIMGKGQGALLDCVCCDTQKAKQLFVKDIVRVCVR